MITTVTNMKTKVDIDDFLTLLYWVKTFFVIENKKFKYQNLLDQAETYKLKETKLDTQIHQIDELMIDAFHIYSKLKETEDRMQEIIKVIEIPFINADMMMNESNKYKRIFEDLLENYKYEDPEIRGIQKGYLAEKMKEYVHVEDYENAARVRDIIKEC